MCNSIHNMFTYSYPVYSCIQCKGASKAFFSPAECCVTKHSKKHFAVRCVYGCHCHYLHVVGKPV